LETAKPTKVLYIALHSFHKKGYILALDDFIHDSTGGPFYMLSDIVKRDYLVSTLQEIHLTIAAVKKHLNIK
tara:strand:- start:145 stop:360 length:216 start_codon:yes stop_codon:yes gene_type:complete